MRVLILSALFLIYNPAFSQTKEVKGYMIGNTPYNCETQFKGDYFTIIKKDGYAIVKLDGTEVASGIKAPTVGFTKKVFNLSWNLFCSGRR